MNETAQQLPRFAVVGHPNKGKSSVVATLAQNDSIAIAMEPGTTRDSHRYPMKVDDTTLYELIDTPGFQRPRKVLAWLQGHSLSASDRPETVAAFVTSMGMTRAITMNASCWLPSWTARGSSMWWTARYPTTANTKRK